MFSKKFTIYNLQFTNRKNAEKGQTLMELIVVMAVSVIIIGALVFATISSLRNAQFAKNQAQATKLAQEGLEKIRTARDMNAPINSIPGETVVDNWNGDDSGNGSIWNYQIYNGCGSGTSLTTACYFKITDLTNGILTYFITTDKFPTSNTEVIGAFKRVVVLSDEAATSGLQKTVTVSVQWTDFSGPHESQLTTILRKI